ncbi:Rrf2 family transcriptional regulator [Ramlibacter sp.]|uniref:RrF2 family transcriptional regulator n=1 Tax=Ramlibacter sp. TaxID=1917967 RepID=UPI002C53BCF9|nr:Rrf2 family transcriptional regulator [Ramlibacter sp.]HWI83046.1 Rrf2 family transcriptional regulator [Ramlibacter sp.]
MKLTAFTDYSLRVLIYVAAQPKERATIAAIASSFEVSENHLTKVAHFLGKAGWLANVRGKGGGLELAMPPELIRVGEVVRATEGGALPAECFGDGGGHCSIADICRLSGVLAEAVKAFYATLDQYTLADLVHNRQALAKVMFVDEGTAARPARKAA